jgi:rod shape-determining protein MreC
MYNLLRFLIRYHLLFFFILLQGFCGYLIYQNSHYHQAAMVNMANDANGQVYQSYTHAQDYIHLREMSDSLVTENARLRAQLRNAQNEEQPILRTATDTPSVKWMQVYTYMPAKVIRNSVNQTSNYIYINRGSAQGITSQMAVVNPNGIVGQVVNVTEHYAAVMSLLNKSFKVSAKLKHSNYFGTLSWTGRNSTTAKLEEIPKHVKVKIGDTIVTSGFSEIFPENIAVGRVSYINAEPEKNFLEIDVTIATDMNNLSYVYVINHLRKSELAHLDTLVKKTN